MKCPYFCLVLNKKDFEKEVDRLMRKLEIPEEERPRYISKQKGAEVTYISRGNKICCIVSIRDDYKECEFPLIASLLVHEATHIYQEMIKSIDEKNPGDEFHAYSIQWISQELFYSFFKQTGIKIPILKGKKKCTK